MLRKMLAVFTAVAAALLVMGVAWASGDSSQSSTLRDDSVTSTSDDRSSTSTTDRSSTSTTTPGSSTSTTIDDRTTSTTTPGSSTSTTIDDDDEDVADGDYEFQVATAGTVVIRVTNGDLSLLSVTTNAGWSFEVEKNRSDVVEVEFAKGESEASIKVEPDDGELKVEIKFKSN